MYDPRSNVLCVCYAKHGQTYKYSSDNDEWSTFAKSQSTLVAECTDECCNERTESAKSYMVSDNG